MVGVVVVGALEHPLHISLRVSAAWPSLLQNRLFGVGLKPFVDFRMPVREGKAAGAIVIGGWQVVKRIRCGKGGEQTVIDAVRVFVRSEERRVGKEGRSRWAPDN